MSPLDDELRSLLHARADVLSPAPDPLTGIERRAKRMRRNRVAASVAGSALVVAAIAVAVPSLVPDRGGSSMVATTPTPSVEPSPSPTSAGPLPAGALDPQHPWPYRGVPLSSGDITTLQAEWQTKHPGAVAVPLFGQVYEPSGRGEVAFVSTGGGPDRWGIATSSEAGWTWLYDAALPFGTKVLMAALPGDEVARLLVVAAPRTGAIQYASDGEAFRDIQLKQMVEQFGSPGSQVETATGIGLTALEGDTSKDVVRVLDGNGDLDNPVFVGPAPDAGDADNGGAPTSTTPDNLVSWPSRGTTPEPAFWDKALTAFAQGLGAKRSDVEGKVLFAGDDDARNVFVFGQAWIKGNDAHSFGYSVNSRGIATPFLGPVTEKGPAVLAFVVPAGAGQSRDLLVVIPEPAVKKTFYGEAQSEYIEITGQDYLDGVTLIDRFPDQQDGNDMLKLLDAAGRKVFEGKVGPLLCGVKECG